MVSNVRGILEIATTFFPSLFFLWEWSTYRRKSGMHRPIETAGNDKCLRNNRPKAHGATDRFPSGYFRQQSAQGIEGLLREQQNQAGKEDRGCAGSHLRQGIRHHCKQECKRAGQSYADEPPSKVIRENTNAKAVLSDLNGIPASQPFQRDKGFTSKDRPWSSKRYNFECSQRWMYGFWIDLHSFELGFVLSIRHSFVKHATVVGRPRI